MQSNLARRMASGIKSEVSRRALAAVLVVVWMYAAVLLYVVGSLMSLDQEWTGWGDIFANPYILLVIVPFSAVVAVAVVLLLRRPRK